MFYGKLFPLYLILNTILQFLFAIFGLKYMERYKIFSLVKLTKSKYLVLDFIRALLLYGFQYINDLKNEIDNRFEQ
jgi:hypothetical protein